MAEKPRNRPPARSHKQQTMDRRNSKAGGQIAPSILSKLHKARDPMNRHRIMQNFVNGPHPSGMNRGRRRND